MAQKETGSVWEIHFQLGREQGIRLTDLAKGMIKDILRYFKTTGLMVTPILWSSFRVVGRRSRIRLRSNFLRLIVRWSKNTVWITQNTADPCDADMQLYPSQAMTLASRKSFSLALLESPLLGIVIPYLRKREQNSTRKSYSTATNKSLTGSSLDQDGKQMAPTESWFTRRPIQDSLTHSRRNAVASLSIHWLMVVLCWLPRWEIRWIVFKLSWIPW